MTRQTQIPRAEREAPAGAALVRRHPASGGHSHPTCDMCLPPAHAESSATRAGRRSNRRNDIVIRCPQRLRQDRPGRRARSECCGNRTAAPGEGVRRVSDTRLVGRRTRQPRREERGGLRQRLRGRRGSHVRSEDCPVWCDCLRYWNTAAGSHTCQPSSWGPCFGFSEGPSRVSPAPGRISQEARPGVCGGSLVPPSQVKRRRGQPASAGPMVSYNICLARSETTPRPATIT